MAHKPLLAFMALLALAFVACGSSPAVPTSRDLPELSASEIIGEESFCAETECGISRTYVAVGSDRSVCDLAVELLEHAQESGASDIARPAETRAACESDLTIQWRMTVGEYSWTVWLPTADSIQLSVALAGNWPPFD